MSGNDSNFNKRLRDIINLTAKIDTNFENDTNIVMPHRFICHGIAGMAMLDILDGNNILLPLLNKIYEFSQDFDINNYDPLEAAKWLQTWMNQNLSKDQQINFKALIDGIGLYHDPNRWYTAYLLQDNFGKSLGQFSTIQNISNLVKPFDNYNVDIIHVFSGCYTQEQLIIYLQTLTNTIKEKKTCLFEANNHNVALILSSLTHSIALGYNETGNTWIMFDVNQKSKIGIKYQANYIENLNQLAINILAAFKKPLSDLDDDHLKIRGFSTRIFCKKLVNNSKLIDKNKFVIQLHQNFAKNNLHNITENRNRDFVNEYWLVMAARDGDLQLFQQLIDSVSNIETIKQALRLAIDNSKKEIIEIIFTKYQNNNDLIQQLKITATTYIEDFYNKNKDSLLKIIPKLQENVSQPNLTVAFKKRKNNTQPPNSLNKKSKKH
jgi:hypothetical protein